MSTLELSTTPPCCSVAATIRLATVCIVAGELASGSVAPRRAEQRGAAVHEAGLDVGTEARRGARGTGGLTGGGRAVLVLGGGPQGGVRRERRGCSRARRRERGTGRLFERPRLRGASEHTARDDDRDRHSGGHHAATRDGQPAHARTRDT